MKTMALPQFLTEAQIAEALRLYTTYGMPYAVDQIQQRVIAPNMAAINEKLGQENDERYLTYAVVHVFMQAAKVDVAAICDDAN